MSCLISNGMRQMDCQFNSKPSEKDHDLPGIRTRDLWSNNQHTQPLHHLGRVDGMVVDIHIAIKKINWLISVKKNTSFFIFKKSAIYTQLQLQQMNGAFMFGKHFKWNEALHLMHFCSFKLLFRLWHIHIILQSQALIVLHATYSSLKSRFLSVS
jgi:hypothetical protein